jgi:uncharacterized protein YbjQ (UPF0145 family)
MRFQIFGRAENSGQPIEPFIVEADDEEDARRRAKAANTIVERVQKVGGTIVTTGNEVAGYAIMKYLGIIRGIVVRSPSIGQSFLGGLKQIVGGNIEAYADVCEAAREEAYKRMVQHAEEAGADAVIGMRYDATEFSSSVTEVLAYGTAVKLARAKPPG